MPSIPVPIGYKETRLPKVEVDPIEYLVRRKFPLPLKAMLLKYGNLPETGLTSVGEPLEGPESEEQAYRMELIKMPEAERRKLFEQEKLTQQNEAAERIRLAAEKEELERPYNCGAAIAPDYSYWAKMGTWDWNEAVALSLGRDPEVVTPQMLDRYKYVNSPFLKRYHQQRELIKRAPLWSGSYVTRPLTFYEWAKKYQVEIPAELAAQLELFANPVDWKAAFIGLKQERDALEAQKMQLESQLAALPVKVEKELSTTETNSLMKMLYAMAKVEYGYTPDVRGTAATDIEKVVTEIGLTIDVDTVRKWLKKSAQYCREEGAE